MNWFSNNLNWLIYVFVLVIPLVSSVLKWLQEQAAKKKAESEKRRRAESQLRTGRAEPASPTPTSPSSSAPQPQQTGQAKSDRPENFAERRRRQIEELKRRQEAAQRQRDAAQRSPGQQSPVPAPAPMPAPMPAPVPSSPAPQRRRTPAPAGPTMTARAPVEQPTPEIESLAAKFERRAKNERLAAGPVLPVAGGGSLHRGLDRETLRRAVVLAEVLAPPVGMRDDTQRAV